MSRRASEELVPLNGMSKEAALAWVDGLRALPPLTAKTPSERKAAERQRRQDAGLVRLELWAHPDDHAALKALAEKLAKRRAKTAPAKTGAPR